MQIQLKQAEIVEALKQYIAKQGISLSGKTVQIAFTAGRKESGISADLVIEDSDIPGFTDSEDEQKEPAKLSVVASNPEPAPEEPKPEQQAAPVANGETAVVSKPTSLFN